MKIRIVGDAKWRFSGISAHSPAPNVNNANDSSRA